ncbi:PmoA family protein, partial [Candidatus Sumerlaeota bacterium]|nr:PmoA family protein [Candidatus Sumerlaeota bacterium]
MGCRHYRGAIVVLVLSGLTGLTSRTSLTGLTGPTSAQAAGAQFRFEESESKYLRLFEGDKPVLVYNFGMMLGGSAPEKFRRSSYVHPIYGLDGEVLTDDFPRDHYHHRGLFWAWVRVDFGGQTYDPWAVSGMPAKFEKWLS